MTPLTLTVVSLTQRQQLTALACAAKEHQVQADALLQSDWKTLACIPGGKEPAHPTHKARYRTHRVHFCSVEEVTAVFHAAVQQNTGQGW